MADMQVLSESQEFGRWGQPVPAQEFGRGFPQMTPQEFGRWGQPVPAQEFGKGWPQALAGCGIPLPVPPGESRSLIH